MLVVNEYGYRICGILLHQEKGNLLDKSLWTDLCDDPFRPSHFNK